MRYVYPVSEHEKAIQEAFGEATQVEEGRAPVRCILLAFVNRSGSNYLAELLKSTGKFTGFEESLNDFSVRYLAPRYQAKSLAEYLSRLQRESAKTPGEIWGVKVGWMQLAMLLRTQAIPNAITPTVVLVRRRDVVSQAISFYIADQTGQWTSGTKSTVSRENIAYDAEAIFNHLRGIIHSYTQFETLLLLANLPYHEVVYEDLLDRPQGTISALTFNLVGQSFGARTDAVRTKIQRNDVDDDFKRRFLADLQSMEWYAADG